MEKLIKNNLGQWKIVEEQLNKSNEQTEELEKAESKPTFSHGSIIHVNKGVHNKGYEVIEEKTNGEKIKHPNVSFAHMDAKCKEHNGRLRIEDSKDKSKDLYHQLKVDHTTRTTHDSILGSRSHTHERLLPHGEPWRKGRKEE